MTEKLDIPQLGFGLGLRTKHYAHILEHRPAIDWFEVISENFMDTDGRPKRILERIREHYPVVMHGVALSIGTVDPINSEYMQKLKALAEWLEPAWISDHLCWTGVAHKNTHDLLPVPYTEEALAHIIDRICQVQDYLGRPILLENPSTYLEYNDSTMPEAEFMARMVEASGCGLLLDVNNVYVTCFNHRLDPKAYIDSLPLEQVGQIHLSGHTNKGTHIIDTHDDHVIDEVWALYRYVIHKAGMKNTMVEWDDHIPAFDVLNAELEKAKQAVANCDDYGDLPTFRNDLPPRISNAPVHYEEHQHRLQTAMLERDNFDAKPDEWIRPKQGFAPHAQLQVYINAYHWRLEGILLEDFETLGVYVGKKTMHRLVEEYVLKTPSMWFNVAKYLSHFADFVKQHPACDAFAHELAVLETALARIFHEEETPPLQPENITHLTPETLMQICLPCRTALRLLTFEYNVNHYFQQVMDKTEPDHPQLETTYLAVYRHEDTLWRLALEKEEYQLLEQLQQGRTVGEALVSVLEKKIIPEEELLTKLQIWFARWIRNGLLASNEALLKRKTA